MFTAAYVLLADTIFGQVSPPPGVAKFGGGDSGGGLIIFISNLIKVAAIAAGIFGVFNIISAGYVYITSNGNPKATEQAMNMLFMSLIGLILIIGSFTIIAIVSLILFGDASYILNPKIPSVK